MADPRRKKLTSVAIALLFLSGGIEYGECLAPPRGSRFPWTHFAGGHTEAGQDPARGTVPSPGGGCELALCSPPVSTDWSEGCF